MTLKARKYKVPKIRLRFDHEYASIDRQTLGAPNDDGERPITWTRISTNTRVDIQELSVLSGRQLKMFDAGLIELCDKWALFETSADIEAKDKVTDVDGNEYTIEEVSPWQTHKEALLRKTE